MTRQEGLELLDRLAVAGSAVEVVRRPLGVIRAILCIASVFATVAFIWAVLVATGVT